MSDRKFYMAQNDLLPVLSVTPTDGNGVAVAVPDGAPVVFNMRPMNTTTPKVNRATATALGGVLSYAWTGTDTDTAGTFVAEFEWTNGLKPQTFPNNKAGRLIIEIEDDVA